jgi:hypothetical protein
MTFLTHIASGLCYFGLFFTTPKRCIIANQVLYGTELGIVWALDNPINKIFDDTSVAHSVPTHGENEGIACIVKIIATT